jgi:hypothetical protein
MADPVMRTTQLSRRTFMLATAVGGEALAARGRPNTSPTWTAR